MPLPIETINEVERGSQVLSVIDSFWTELHSSKAMFRAYGRGLGEFLAQRYLDFLHIYNTLDRNFMPIARVVNWKRLSFTETQLNESTSGIMRYGDGAVYGVNTGNVVMYVYGGFGARTYKSVDIDPTWLASSVLTNTPVNASVALVHGTDFWFDSEQSSIVFRKNPFDNAAMPIVNIRSSSGAVTDREITLWAFDSREDLDDINKQMGTLLGVHAKSTKQYRDVLNAAIDSFVDGPTQLNMTDLLCGYAGVECVQNETETVEEIQRDQTNLYVITDKQAYVFSANAEATVAVGDTVRKGDVLADTIVVYKDPVDFCNMRGLTLSGAFGKVFSSPLAFYNENKDLVVTTANDKTKISVELGGSPSVIREFWDNVHARGLETGTLAEALDLRSAPDTEPGVQHLPSKVNPFTLLINELRGNFAIIRIKGDAVAATADQIPLIAIARKCLPPRCLVLIIVEYSVDFDYYGLDSTPDDMTPGTVDTLSAGVGAVMTGETIGILSDPDNPHYTDSGPFAWVVNNTL